MNALPIYELLPQLNSALANNPAVIIHAPPGAGKTTVVPLELLKAPFLNKQKILMLEPRRLAAANAARWMAAKIGEDVGRTVGYAIRFERRTSSATRIEVVTEGMLTRRLQHDPLLQDVGVVIFDEFHERNLHSDVALALCRDIQQGLRTDLKIVVMSATLDCEPVSRMLCGAPILCSHGKSYPVDIRYVDEQPRSAVAESAARVVQRALLETDGDILVFLPGAGEIRVCERYLERSLGEPAPLIFPLYGDLPYAAQEKAIMPATQRRVVLATNIAETSLTIQGVRVVVDTGLSRQLRFDPLSGLNRLLTLRISAASAAQRCGRAARQGPGICYRIWSEHTQQALVPFNQPEILTADLAPLALDLALWGVVNAEELTWIDPPPSAALAEAKKLLINLGAMDSKGFITAVGKEMAALPVHPRLAHMLLEGKKRGCASLASDLAAILSERDIFRNIPADRKETSASDLLDRVEALWEWRMNNSRHPEWIDHNACKSVDRAAEYLSRCVGVADQSSDPSAESVGLLLALAFPDRIAQLRDAGSGSYLLANGRGGKLSRRSAVLGHAYIIAAAVEGGEGGDGSIHLASAVPLELLRREFASLIEKRRVVSWDGQLRKVCAREDERLQALVLKSRPVAPSAEEVRFALLEGIRTSGLAMLNWSKKAIEFRDRVRFLFRNFPDEGWPDLSDEKLAALLEEWLAPWLDRINSAEEISRLDLLPPLQRILRWEQLQELEQCAPTHIKIPSGSNIALRYPPDGGVPVLAVKLQEMFGLAETPSVARGRVPVILHLLSPAGRPLQVTQDLRNFWNSTYREVKKELKGRYPKHPWPDDPWNATPTRHTKKKPL